MNRRDFIRVGSASSVVAYLSTKFGSRRAFGLGGSFDPAGVPQFLSPLVKPPAFRPRWKLPLADFYEIAVRQFEQQILPPGCPQTTVWSYGPARAKTIDLASGFFYPAFTIENRWRRPTYVKWVNGLVDKDGAPLRHLLPVDPTLHWANPIGDRDGHPPHHAGDPYWANPLIDDNGRYVGPVPLVTHVHGADTFQESDGYPEAWYLPDWRRAQSTWRGKVCTDSVRWTRGTYFDRFDPGNGAFGPGYATFGYPNDQRATTLWYHDHSLGMTRVNVYAGPAGFFMLRGGPDDQVRDTRGGGNRKATLPGPAPGETLDPFGDYYEIPIAVQDRSFNEDGSLFYPDNRAFFEALEKEQLHIPFFPDMVDCGGVSDIAPIWNPEFFGNTIVVNGQTWPYLDTEKRRYRFRLLNGCQSRFLILDFSQIPNVEVWQIGAEGGFLPEPVNITAVQNNRLLMAPAERADVIVDFTNVPPGMYRLLNLGPDEPFGGGQPDVDFPAADPGTTGQVMEFRVGSSRCYDPTTPPMYLKLPAIEPFDASVIRQVSLNENSSSTVKVSTDAGGNVVLDCNGEFFGPESALCGTLNPDGSGNPLLWMDEITETPVVRTTEEWEIHNFTMDAHPIHIHLVQFQVVGRQPMMPDGTTTSAAGSNDPLPTERGFKDTVIAYPGEVTKIRARFSREGRYVWHCHIVEHEDNEMMRPYDVVNKPRTRRPPIQCVPNHTYKHHIRRFKRTLRRTR